MQLFIQGNANLRQMKAEFSALTAQVAAFNQQLAESTMMPVGGSPAGYKRATRAAGEATRAYQSALASSGAFRVETLKVNDAIEKQTDLLQRNKLGFREVFGKKNQAMMRSIYREQLALNHATTQAHRDLIGDGKTRVTMAIPTEVHQSWDTLNNKIGMFRHQLDSASSELVNWGKNTQWAGRQLMVGFTMPVAAFGAAAGVMAYQADKQLTRIAKVYDTTADANSQSTQQMIAVEKELQALREAGMETATKAAKEYGSAMTDTLDVQAELAATGITGNRLQESTAEVMRISTLGEIDRTVATKAMIAMQSTLNATTRETADIFNYMNSIENATSLATADFAEAIPRALGPMREMSAEGASSVEVMQNLSMLMVAMKERGIEAGEGANAIKAMMQRLYRPSKQVREEWTQLAGVDPLKFVEQSGGDVMKILPKISEAVRDVDKATKIKLLAGLFGTYQVTRMSAMLKGFQDLENGVGQVSRVMETNMQTTEDWGKTAERELGKMQESASGKFLRAWRTLQTELAKVGEPFLEVASSALTFASSLVSLFNKMPEWSKKAVIFGAIFAAIVGPVVMLVGLFANFAGNIGKFVAWALRAVTTFRLMDKAAWAAAASAKLVEQEFTKQATAAQMAENQTKALTFALNEYASTMTKLAHLPPPRPIPNFAPVDLGVQHGPAAPTAAQRATLLAQQRARNIDLTPMQAQQKITEKISNNMSSSAASTALMVAGMGAMIWPSGEVVNNLGMAALMIGSMAGPLSGLKDALTLGAKRAKDAATGVLNVRKEAVASAKQTGKLAGKAGVAKAAFMGIGSGLASMMSPLMWGITAVGLVGGGIYLWSKHLEEARKEQTRLNNSVNSMADKWAESAGVAKKSWAGLTLEIKGAAKASKEAQLFEQYSSGDMKGIVDDYKNEDFSDEDRNRFLREHFLELQVEYGLSAREASQNIRALMAAAGAGMAEQIAKVKELEALYGNITQSNIGEYLANQIDIANHLDIDTKEWETAALDVSRAFLTGFNKNMEPGQAKELVDQFASAATSEWENAFDAFSENSSLSDAMQRLGIESGDELRKAVRESGGITEFVTQNMDALGDLGVGALGMLSTALGKADKAERAFFGNVAKSNSELGRVMEDNVDTFDEWVNHWMVASQGMNLDEARGEVKGLAQDLIDNSDVLTRMALQTQQSLGGLSLSTADGLKTVLDMMNPEQVAEFGTAVSTIAKMQGIQVGKTHIQTYMNILNGIKVETENVEKATKKWAKAASFTVDELSSIRRSGMEGVQEDISNMLTDNFESSLERATERHQNYWDAAVERMEKSQEAATARQEAQHEKEMERFERRWEARTERVEKSYDRRIKATEKAIEAEQKAEEIRQRIFDAEQARLDRLTESANRTIDFNMALQTGELDEAAKIRNDIEAAAQEWALSDAADEGSSRSQRRIDRLEDRAERLGERKNVALEALEKTEEAQRKSLEKQQEQERKYLERVQEMRRDALDEQVENARKAFDKEWDIRRDSLDKQLDTFKSFVPKNMKQLERWMKEVGITYEDFGNDTLNPKSEKWGRWFQNSLKSHIRDAGREIRGDQMWERLGKSSAKMTLRGMGFGSMNAFAKFIKTGELPANFGNLPPLKRNKSGNFEYGGSTKPEGHPGFGPTMHTGGVVGGVGEGSRKGVAKNLKGLHTSEQMIRAQKGEFVVNRDSARKHRGLLEAVNNGVYDSSIMGGATPGFASFVAAALNRGFAAGIARALMNANDSKQQSLGPFGKISAGVYGDSTFSAEQLNNARIIADVGRSLGASSRDIIIALMTAMQESTLRNLDWGDRDSVGLFQQRDAWGSFGARTNPREAAKMFFTGGAQGQRGLFDFPDRNSMSLAEAAQAVQVSAYPDAYAKWADEARAIFSALRSSSGGGYVPGPGGRHRPVRGYGYGSIHGSETGYPAVDFAMPVGNPVYAVADGTITRSYDIRGYESRSPHGGLGYKSYGRVVYLRTDGGPEVLYAHLSRRSVREGQRVSGGAVLGYSGNTGYSTGPHLHFGATNGPLAWLKTGGMTLNDGMAMLHRGETVLTKPLTEDLQRTVRAFGAASKEKLSGKDKRRKKRRRLGYDPTEKNMWGPETTRVTGMDTNGAGWTYTSGMRLIETIAKIEAAAVKNLSDTGAKATIKIGTLNTKVGTAAVKTQQDLKRLMPGTDFLALTEMAGKFGAIKKFLADRGWGLLGGNTTDKKRAALAFNKNTQKLHRSGIELLGKKRGNFVGGREDRYANYGLFTDKDSGRKTWQVSAHTVPTPRMDARHRELFMEQWGNLDALVNRLKGSGAPVFVAGDLNNNPNRNWWRTPAGLKSYRGRGVDWIFADPRLTDVVRSSFMGNMHTDHGGAVLADYHIPSRKNGAQNIRWDNTLVNMHKKESILTEDQSNKFRWLADNIDKVATKGGNQYNIDVTVEDTNASPRDIAKVVIREIERSEARKPMRRK